MNNESSDKSIKDKVLKAIEAGKVTMRPKWYFILQASLLILGTILTVFTLVYLISFIFSILGPGPRTLGLGIYLHSLPWLIVISALIFLIVLEILVKRFSFAYRKPLLYSTVGIIVFVILGGFLVAKTSFHKRLFDRAHDNHLPFGNQFYRHYEGHLPPPEHEDRR